MIKEEIHQLEERYEEEVTTIVQKAGDLLRSKYGLWFLGIVSFADSALSLPILTDPFMMAYITANRARVWAGFLVTVATSVLGGLMVYLVSAFFIDQLLTLFSPESVEVFNEMVKTLDQGTFALALLGALTPIPYSFVAIAAGALKGNIFMFVLGTIIGRVLRFGIVAYFTYRFGDRALGLIREHLRLASVVAVLLVALYIISVFSF